jgi:uncharacterized protein (TIGR00299 family) protein
VRVAHFDCFSGISGDMTLAALIDVGADVDAIRRGLASLGLPINLIHTKVKRSGVSGIHVTIETQDQAKHRHLPNIEKMIDQADAAPVARDLAKRIFRRLGEAEAKVHNIPIEKVHFHEVGALDSIADIVGSAIGLTSLGVERFSSRSVPPGSGTVKCDHGIMPVPAPATAILLQGVPLADVPVTGEMTTPTGAAILTTVVSQWTDQPAMTVDRIGHGAGTKDFPDWPNVLRLLIGEATGSGLRLPSSEFQDTVWLLETNLDDVPAEVVGYCSDRLFAAGALDVFMIPIQMKKNRPGVLLSAICPEEKVGELEAILFRETGTFGIRRFPAQRHKLRREAVTVQTPWGPVKGKKGWREGLIVFTPEYDDCVRVAREHGVPLREVFDAVRRNYTDNESAKK